MDNIVRKLQCTAALVEESMNHSMRALSELDQRRASAVILRFQGIGVLERENDRLCLEFLASDQPTAKSLRFAYAAVKINAILERAGDHAESIARQVLILCSLDAKLPREHFKGIANITISMLASAFAAFVTKAPEQARSVMQMEEKVNRLRYQLGMQLVVAPESNEIPAQTLAPLTTILNCLERAADLARDICQEVIYLFTEEYWKHPGGDVFRVLFVDDDNSCASQIAEAIGNSLGQPQFVFWSAGLHCKSVEHWRRGISEKPWVGYLWSQFESHHTSSPYGTLSSHCRTERRCA